MLKMKPKVICHIMSSVDGRLLTRRWSKPHNGASLSEVCNTYSVISNQLCTDAWMFGKNTLQEFGFTSHYNHLGKAIVSCPKSYHGKHSSTRMFVVADPLGEITYTSDTVRNDNIITILGERVSEDYLKHLREMGISYLFAGKEGTNLELALETLHDEFGIKSLTIQGGGIINGAFLKAGLLDELSLLIYPGIDGLSGIPSIFEYHGTKDELPALGQSLEPVNVETLEYGVVHLRYKFHKS
ncbi:MAG: dihydrofolate reductase family protein [Muribaculaceae bacterium]